MKTNLKWWTYLVILIPMIVGILVISKLSIETQIERYNNDPTGIILVGLLIFAVFFGWPIIFSFFFKTVSIDNSETILVRYPFRLQTKKYRIQEITEIKEIERLYGFGNVMRGMKISFKNQSICSLDSRFMTNYAGIEKIIKNKAPVGNKR